MKIKFNADDIAKKMDLNDLIKRLSSITGVQSVILCESETAISLSASHQISLEDIVKVIHSPQQ